MKGQQIQELRQLSFKDKCHKMAETLRNCKDLNPIKAKVHYVNEEGNHYYCAYGALGFRAGIPHDELKMDPYTQILEVYGFTEEEMDKIVYVPTAHPMVRDASFRHAIFTTFDYYGDYDITASWLDTLE